MKKLARKLRKSATAGEIALWKRIRRKALGVEFHRQVPVDNYCIDFYCHELKLAVEIDGGVHDETTAAKDALRQQELERFGICFLRFSEHEAKHCTDRVVSQLSGFLMKVQDPNVGKTNSSDQEED